MDLILFTAVLVIMQLIRGKHEGGMFLRNKTARIICMAAFLVVFLPLAYITISTVFILGKPAFMSMDAWVFMFGKQGGANQYILHLWWAHQRYCWTWELRNKFIKITRMESEHILFEIPCGLCYFTQFEHKLGTLLLGEWDGFTVQIVHLPHKEAQVHWMTPKPNLIGRYRSVIFFQHRVHHIAQYRRL